jgi:hypothetical protein
MADRDLPTFIVIGAMKSGSTSLRNYLAAHPQVFMTEPKEPHFFDREWDRGIEWYRSLFADAGSAIARGEASVTYTYEYDTPRIAERIHSQLPDAHLVYLMRHPVERIRSHYAFQVLHRGETRPIAIALQEDDFFLQASRYAFHLEAFLEHFSRDRILLLTSDQLRHERVATLKSVFRFIGVDPEVPIENLGTEYFQTRKVRSPRPWARRAHRIARRTPIHFLPSTVNRRLYRAARRGFRPSRTKIPADVECWLWEVLTPQMTRLGELAGPDMTIWEPTHH